MVWNLSSSEGGGGAAQSSWKTVPSFAAWARSAWDHVWCRYAAGEWSANSVGSGDPVKPSTAQRQANSRSASTPSGLSPERSASAGRGASIGRARVAGSTELYPRLAGAGGGLRRGRLRTDTASRPRSGGVVRRTPGCPPAARRRRARRRGSSRSIASARAGRPARA
jgi:hypothetical protein